MRCRWRYLVLLWPQEIVSTAYQAAETRAGRGRRETGAADAKPARVPVPRRVAVLGAMNHMHLRRRTERRRSKRCGGMEKVHACRPAAFSPSFNNDALARGGRGAARHMARRGQRSATRCSRDATGAELQSIRACRRSNIGLPRAPHNARVALRPALTARRRHSTHAAAAGRRSRLAPTQLSAIDRGSKPGLDARGLDAGHLIRATCTTRAHLRGGHSVVACAPVQACRA